MLKKKYLDQVTRIAKENSPNKAEIFVFGSSISRERFGDCDLGVRGNITDRDIRNMRQAFEDSTLPYRVDVVNFNTVSHTFQKHVFQSPVLWIQPSK